MKVRKLTTRYQKDRQNFEVKGYPDSIPLNNQETAVSTAANSDQKMYIMLVFFALLGTSEELSDSVLNTLLLVSIYSKALDSSSFLKLLLIS